MEPVTRSLCGLGSLLVIAGFALGLFLAERPEAIERGAADKPQNGSVMADDYDRRLVVDARLSPYSAVGKFMGTMACTAAIVADPRVIVTAGHCITQRDGTIRRSNLSFRQAYQAGSDLGRFEARVWAVGAKQSFSGQSRGDASKDWAILILDRAPEGVHPFLLARQSSETLQSIERQVLIMPSYSDDIADAEALTVDPACAVRDLIWDVLVHDCRGQFGSSGAPLLTPEGLQLALVGVNAGSIFASDEMGHAAKYIGNQAIGSWMLRDELVELTQHLNHVHDIGVAAY
jgi:V8-like Glu-specific endopeptidase